jgi:hypothetical protein
MRRSRSVVVPLTMSKPDARWMHINPHMDFLDHVYGGVLYWDKMILSTAPNLSGYFFSPEYHPSVDELVRLGAAEEYVITESEGLDPPTQVEMMTKQYDLIRSLMQEKEDWSVLGNPELDAEDLWYNVNDTTEDNAATYEMIEVQCFNALPVPRRGVPFEDILEFKESRKDQLRRASDEVLKVAATYVGLMTGEDAARRSIIDLTTAIDDVRRVHNEKWHTRTFNIFKSSFALDLVIPYVVHKFYSVPVDKAFLLGAGITVARSTIAALGGKPSMDSPFACVVEAEDL